RSVQSPVRRISASAGLAPSWSATAPYTSQASGSRQSRKSTGLAAGCSSSFFTAPGSEKLLQVHAGVQLAHLRLVAVERQRGLALGEQPACLADAALCGLAPARMVDRRIHVGI